MQLITAPNRITIPKEKITCFLGGGITDCPDWQKEVANELSKLDTEDLICFNPRQPNFDIKNPNASFEQIKWEFDHLSNMDIFSMYFSESKSNQPICLYELGRYISEIQKRFPNDYINRIIVSVENGYSRIQDVIIQTQLALGKNIVQTNASYKLHAYYIFGSYKTLKENNQGE